MSKVEDFKKIIRSQRGSKRGGITLNQLFGGDVKPDIYSERIFSKIDEILPDILNEVVVKLVSNDLVWDLVISGLKEKLRTPEDGHTPKVGTDYFTPRERRELINDIQSKIKTPKKGVDFFTNKELGEVVDQVVAKLESKKTIKTNNGQSMKLGLIKDVDYLMPDTIRELIKKGKISGAEIVALINALPIRPELQIDEKHIKNKDPRKGANMGGVHRGGLKLIWNTELEGTINGVNAVFTIPSNLPAPIDDKFIVSARGVLKTEEANDFTVSNSNRTITFVDAPPDGSERPRIIIYHGH